MDIINDVVISEAEDVKDLWEVIKPTLFNQDDDSSLLIAKAVEDAALLKKDRHGRVKFRKPKHEESNVIKIGDVVKYNGATCKVVDFDSAYVCLEIDGKIGIAERSEVETIN